VYVIADERLYTQSSRLYSSFCEKIRNLSPRSFRAFEFRVSLLAMNPELGSFALTDCFAKANFFSCRMVRRWAANLQYPHSFVSMDFSDVTS
jgi:hypothetical protein